MALKLALPNLKTKDSLRGYLHGVGMEIGAQPNERQFAEELDRRDDLACYGQYFHVPRIKELLEPEEVARGVDVQDKCIYLNGCSLGLLPIQTTELIDGELKKWQTRAIRGHYIGEHPWYPIEDEVIPESARIVGAKSIEVTIMNTLTVNMHLGMASFYKPTATRFKILMENNPFPSDKFAVESQVRWHGLDPDTAILYARSKSKGETHASNEEIIDIIEKEGDSIALVYLCGVHYTTGYLFNIKDITAVAHSKGCYAGFDLAHAAGNVELHLHDWEVDFACWCTYKYLNAGPGGIAGFFVHEKFAYQYDHVRLIGWWSHDRNTRLSMPLDFKPQPGAAGFQLSNPPVFQVMSLLGSLRVFKLTTMADLNRKSRILTTYLELLLECLAENSKFIRIITSSDPAERGCHLFLHFEHFSEEYVQKYLLGHGIVVDTRKNGVRVAPVPLYNTFMDVLKFYEVLASCITHFMKDSGSKN